MYVASADPYCYPGSSVLKNLPGLASQAALDRFEAVATARRFLEPMPAGRWSVRHYRAVHRHIFQDVYAWAGRDRTVRIGKGGSMFCYPENIARELRCIFGKLKADGSYRGLAAQDFARKSARFLADLNAIHPFRDGNGRTQLAFMTLLAADAGHPFDIEKLDPVEMLQAMVTSFHGRNERLVQQIEMLVG